MKKDIQVVDSVEMLETALQRLHSCECHTIPVINRGQLAGLITMDNVGEFLLIQATLGASRKGPEFVLQKS
jgi:predicted transcriptional regulator